MFSMPWTTISIKVGGRKRTMIKGSFKVSNPTFGKLFETLKDNGPDENSHDPDDNFESLADTNFSESQGHTSFLCNRRPRQFFPIDFSRCQHYHKVAFLID